MKINHIIKIQLIILTGILLVWSCSSDVDYGEQYKKTIYMVNSNNLLYQAEHFYGEENAMVFSVYCASSEPISSDVTVRLKFDRNQLDSLNAIRTQSDPKYIAKELLPVANYKLPTDLVITIKAGTQYGTLRVPFKTDNLAPFNSYTLPLIIVSNSSGYDINPKLKSVVYEPIMVNKYSGSYTGVSSESVAVARPVQPILKALSANTLHMPIHNLIADIQYINTNYMQLTIAEDGKTVRITPLGNAKVVDMGGSIFDKDKQTFELYYKFTDSAGKIFTLKEIIVNINAPK
jgi:hypothetical protein